MESWLILTVFKYIFTWGEVLVENMLYIHNLQV